MISFFKIGDMIENLPYRPHPPRQRLRPLNPFNHLLPSPKLHNWRAKDLARKATWRLSRILSSVAPATWPSTNVFSPCPSSYATTLKWLTFGHIRMIFVIVHVTVQRHLRFCSQVYSSSVSVASSYVPWCRFVFYVHRLFIYNRFCKSLVLCYCPTQGFDLEECHLWIPLAHMYHPWYSPTRSYPWFLRHSIYGIVNEPRVPSRLIILITNIWKALCRLVFNQHPFRPSRYFELYSFRHPQVDWWRSRLVLAYNLSISICVCTCRRPFKTM